MNRQVRRAQDKSDRKQERFKTQKRRARGLEQAQRTPKRDGKPGRFAGYLAFLTILLIGLQAVVPAASMSPLDFAVNALFYAVLGYFLCLWLSRRDTKQAPFISVAAGFSLSLLAEASKFLRPEVTAEPLLVFLALPGVLLGAFVARLVYRRG